MNDQPNNATVIGDVRILLTTTTDRAPNLARSALDMAEALWTGAATDPQWQVLQVRDATSGQVLAERRFTKRRQAETARQTVVGRADESSVSANWQEFLDRC